MTCHFFMHTNVIETGFVILLVCVCVHASVFMIICVCSPVVSLYRLFCQCSGNVIDQAVEALVGEEGDFLPGFCCDIIGACVEVSEHHDVLQAEGNGSNKLFAN